jgi:tetratricopeptide (TPR) repeat protein
MRGIIRSAGLLLGIFCVASPLRGQNAPYTLAELVGHVRAELSEVRILALARQRCLSFTLSPRTMDQLRNAGASARLVRDLDTVCRRSQTDGVASTSPAEEALSVGELIARGDRRRGRGDYVGALRDYRQAIAQDGSNARAHYRAGEVLSILNRDSEALTAYQRAASVEPTVSTYHSTVAAILSRLRRYQEAEGHAREAVRLDRGSAPAHYQLGLALKGREQLEAARQSLAEAVRIAPAACGRYRSTMSNAD